jgi:hypothetical protein
MTSSDFGMHASQSAKVPTRADAVGLVHSGNRKFQPGPHFGRKASAVFVVTTVHGEAPFYLFFHLMSVIESKVSQLSSQPTRVAYARMLSNA